MLDYLKKASDSLISIALNYTWQTTTSRRKKYSPKTTINLKFFKLFFLSSVMVVSLCVETLKFYNSNYLLFVINKLRVTEYRYKILNSLIVYEFECNANSLSFKRNLNKQERNRKHLIIKIYKTYNLICHINVWHLRLV